MPKTTFETWFDVFEIQCKKKWANFVRFGLQTYKKFDGLNFIDGVSF